MVEQIVWLLSVAMIVVTVIVHYGFMTAVSDQLIPWAQKYVHSRRVIIYAVIGLLLGHIVEIWLFAAATKMMDYLPAVDLARSNFGSTWGDYLYLSAVNYTSLGDHSVHLIGPARALAACESLVGLLMIAWSAAFMYLKMEMIWERRRARRD